MIDRTMVDSFLPGEDLNSDAWSERHENIGSDRNQHLTGERAQVQIYAGSGAVTGELSVKGPVSGTETTTRIDSVRVDREEVGYYSFIVPSAPGWYNVLLDGEPITTFRAEAGTPVGGEPVAQNIDGGAGGIAGGDGGGTDDEIDPSDYAGIVNADNEQGIALAPALRREGASLGPDGATVNLPDGETVEVGAISDSDEVARYVEGDYAGDVIDADQPATNDPSGSTEASDGFGGVAAVMALAIVGYALSQR